MKFKAVLVIFTASLLFSLCACSAGDEFYLGNGKTKDDVYNDVFNGAEDENEDGENSEDDDSGDGFIMPENAPERVYFTKSGSVWHSRRDCSHLKNSSEIIQGTLKEAFEDGKHKQCSRCLEADENDKDGKNDANDDGNENEDQVPPDDSAQSKPDDSDQPPTEPPLTDGEGKTDTETEEGDVENKDPSNGGNTESDTPNEDILIPPQASDFDPLIFVYYTESSNLWHLDENCESISDGAAVYKIYLFEIRYYEKEEPCTDCVKK